MLTRMLSVSIAKALICCASLLVSATAALAASSVVVERIEVDGKAVAQLANVSMLATGSEVPVVQNLGEKDTVAERMQIIVQARTVITLKSSNGNTITLQPGSRFTVRHVGDDGESYTLDDGSASFDVVKALNFFNVNYRKFLAIVKGTKFSVEVEPEKEIRFAVTEGTVVVEREERVLITAPGKDPQTSELTVHDALQAGKRNTAAYRLGVSSYLRKFNTFEGAEEFFRRQLEQDELSGDSALIATSLINFARILSATGKSELANSPAQRARRVAGQATQLQLDALSILAGIDLDKGRVEQSRQYLQEALTLISSSGNASRDPCLACIQLNMGETYQRPEEYGQAIPWYESALETIGTPLTFEQTRYASLAYYGIARAHFSSGRASISLEYGRKAQLMLEALFEGQFNPALAATYGTMARIYRALGEYRMAVTSADRALKQFQRLFPDERHFSVAAAYQLLAEIKLATDDIESGATALQRVQSILDTVDPEATMDLWPLLHSALSDVEWRRGNGEAAIAHATIALDLSLRQAKTKGLYTSARMYFRLGELYVRTGDCDAAIKTFESSMALLDANFPSAHELAAATRRSAARALVRLNRPHDALDYYLETIIRLKRQHATPLHRSIALAQFEAADTARLATGWQVAIPYFEEALSTFVRLSPDRPSEEIAQLQARLFLAWTALGDEQKANYYIREAQATRDRLDAQAQSANRKEP